jgi:O-antigen/teichoic acid export membrane protein
MLTLGVGQLVTWVGAIVLLVLMPRYLGDVNLGKLSFAFALTALFGLIADLGGSTLLAKEVARDTSRTAALTRAVLLTRVPLGVVAAVMAIAFVWFTGYDDITKQIVYVLCVGTVFTAIGNTIGGALQGLQRMRALTVSMVSGKLLQAGIVAALLLNGAGPLQVAYVSVLATVVGAVVGAVALRRDLFRHTSVDRALLRQVLAGGLPFFVWQASLVVYGSVDVVLLSILTGDAVVGWYSAAYRIIMLPSFMPTIVATAAFPALSAASADPARFGNIARRCIQLVCLVTVPIALGVLVIPDKLIDALGYPAVFSHSIVPIMLLSLHVPFAGIDTIVGTMLATTDRQRSWAMTGVAAAFLNPAANLIAIPATQHLYGNGAIGASVVTVLTEMFMLTVGLRLLPAGLLARSTVGYVGRCLLAGLLMAVAVISVRDLPLVLIVPLGGIVYAASSFALRTISARELRVVVRDIFAARRAPQALAQQVDG